MAVNVKVTKNSIQARFGGIGFHNADATNYPQMTKRHFNEVIAKTWRELSPGFSRIWGGAPSWTRKEMDSFVEYYHQMHGLTDTSLYLTGSTRRHYSQEDKEQYARDVADKLEYLIRDKGLKNIDFYCMSNELALDNWGSMFFELETFKEYHTLLYREFARRNLHVRLAATDAAPYTYWESISWAIKNMDEVTGIYCGHHYVNDWDKEDMDFYKWFNLVCRRKSTAAGAREKRFILGEFGLGCDWANINGVLMDQGRYLDTDEEAEGALMVIDMALAALNAGVYAMALWTFNDYPNPKGLEYRYNKWGLTRWDNEDYSARDTYYCFGLLTKYFKKESKPMTIISGEYLLRAGGVVNDDDSVSIALNNRADKALDIELELNCPILRPLRLYVYDSSNVPRNDFADLQPYSDLLSPSDNKTLKIHCPARSMLMLTTDYLDNKPEKIDGIIEENGVVSWKAATDKNHCYYRVFYGEDGGFTPNVKNQVASTVATSYTPQNNKIGVYKIKSVDKWGNM